MIKKGMSKYQWQDADHDQLLKCIIWCQNRLHIRNWTVSLSTGSNIPKDMSRKSDENLENYDALLDIDQTDFTALMWVPLVRLQEENKNPIESATHELVHLSLEARGMGSDDEDKEERLVKTYSPFVYRDYCRENKIRIAKEKP